VVVLIVTPWLFCAAAAPLLALELPPAPPSPPAPPAALPPWAEEFELVEAFEVEPDEAFDPIFAFVLLPLFPPLLAADAEPEFAPEVESLVD
jgi:hypothetical protein